MCIISKGIMNLASILLAIIIPLIALGVFLFWLISFLFNRRYQEYMQNNENSIRTVIFDREKKVVRYFNRNRMRNVKTVSAIEFFKQYSNEDAIRLEEWLNELTKKYSKVDEIFEINVVTNNGKRNYYSVFRLINVDKDKKVIYLDNYLFHNLSSKYLNTYQLRGKTIDVLIDRLKINTGLRGFAANFQFSSKNSNGTISEINRFLFIQLKDVAAKYVNYPQRQLLETANNQFLIVDFRINDNDSGLKYVHKVVDAMHRYLEINGKLDSTIISVGVVYNSQFPNNPKKLVLKAKDMSEIAFNKNLEIITYSKDSLNELNENKYDSEISHIIKERKVVNIFTPIYDAKKGKVIGYIDLPKPKDGTIQDMEEIFIRAINADESRALISLIVKDSLDIFSEEKSDNSLILFRYLKFAHINDFLSFNRSNVAKDTRQGIIFDEYDISYNTKRKDFFDMIDKLKSRKIFVSLALSDKTLILDQKIYKCFDHFFVYEDKTVSKNRKTDDLNFEIRTIIEKLLKYNRPIILSGVDSWSVVELFIRSGVDYVSSNVISSSSEHLTVPNVKVKAKIKRMIS